MRILHITDAASSGVLTAVTGFARAQAAVPGTEVELVYVPRHDSPSLGTIQEMVSADVTVRRLTASSRAAVPVLAARLPGILARGGHDVIHLHSSRTGLLGRAVGVLTGRRPRIVYSPHCFAFDRSDASPSTVAVLRGLERVGTLLGPRLVLCSPSEEQLAQRSLPRVRTSVLANSVDTAALATFARSQREQGAPDPSTGSGTDAGAQRPLQVVHVGRIAAQKRPQEFGAIARWWAARHKADPASVPAARFRWLGEGDRSLLTPEVEVSGWLSPAELRSELALADVLLFTSAGEGMSISLLEAMAMGVPAVAHDVTGVRDVIHDGTTGILRTDTEDLALALADLARDPDRRHAIGEAAAAEVREHHDLADVAPRSFAAYAAVGIPIPRSLAPRPIEGVS